MKEIKIKDKDLAIDWHLTGDYKFINDVYKFKKILRNEMKDLYKY